MFAHNLSLENAIRFSRFDEQDRLATASPHPFELEEYTWPTAEHYYQAHKFEDLPYAQQVLAAPSAYQAHLAGNRWLKRKVKGWRGKRRIWMTRALYRKAISHQEVKEAILATEDNLIIETSMYDHYWGIGRDQRGENILGKVWMDIRNKLREEKAA